MPSHNDIEIQNNEDCLNDIDINNSDSNSDLDEDDDEEEVDDSELLALEIAAGFLVNF